MAGPAVTMNGAQGRYQGEGHVGSNGNVFFLLSLGGGGDIGLAGDCTGASECIYLSFLSPAASFWVWFLWQQAPSRQPASWKEAGRQAWREGLGHRRKVEVVGAWGSLGGSPGRLDRSLEMSHRALVSFDHEEVEVDKDP